MKSFRRDLFVEMVVDGLMFKKIEDTLFPFFYLQTQNRYGTTSNRG